MNTWIPIRTMRDNCESCGEDTNGITFVPFGDANGAVVCAACTIEFPNTWEDAR
jgi:hypothetical protein